MPSRLRIISLLFVLVGSTAAAAAAERPHWIWTEAKVDAAVRFERDIELDGAVLRAAVRLAGDFCRTTLVVNGEVALVVEPYAPTQDYDVTPWVRRGKNVLALVAEPVAGPSAVAMSFVAEYQDGRRAEFATNERWHVVFPGLPPCADLGAVRPELWGIDRRPAGVSPFENYEQWKQTLDKTAAPQTKFDTAPGFTVTTLRNAAVDEGSWIAMAFDAEGRLTVSREDHGLLRMTLSDDRRTVALVEPIRMDPADAELKECRGLLYEDGRLYANANNSKAMYRLQIDEAGRAHHVTVLREFPGDAGHGRNDLARGPRGALFSMHGDAVLPPGKPLVDRTSPLRESRQGELRKEAYLLRTDFAAKRWELICTGLRNPYGVAVHPNGDVFTYDADNEYDMGTPWYRPTRIVQMLSGADYGYRAAKDQWPPNYPDHPDNGLPTIDVGRGSPTAAMFGTDLKFPPEYRRAMFALDWSYGRVLAVHLAPRGGGYRAALEVFLQGRPLNVTDIAAGPDGAMYLITGGRKTQSALYRVEYTGTADASHTEPAPEESQHERDCAKFADAQRALRKRLEAFHGRADEKALGVAWPLLDDADPTIRHAARIAVEQLPVERWKSRALDVAGHVGQRLPVYMMPARVNDSQIALDLSVLLQGTTAEQSIDERFQALYLYRRCFEQLPDTARDRTRWHPDAILSTIESVRAGPRNVGPYGDDAEFIRRAALYLGELGAPEAVAAAAPLLDDPLQENRLQALLALRSQTVGWTPALRRRYFETLRDGARFVGGQGMPAFLDRIRNDALATLSDDDRRELADVLKPAAVVDEPLPTPRDKVREWKLDALASLTKPNSENRGDAARGEIVFRDALCARCHRAGLVGPAVGPDLTFVARRFSRRDILESILSPSLAVAENYRNAQVITEGGQTYVGRVVSEGDFRSEKLRLSVDPLHPAKVVEIDKKEIAEYRLTETSPMPQGLLDTFTLEEIRDLLAFLESAIAR